MIKLTNVTKLYKNRRGIRNVSFEIIKGKVFSVSDSKDIITINNSSNIINMDITKGDTQNIILNSVSLND